MKSLPLIAIALVLAACPAGGTLQKGAGKPQDQSSVSEAQRLGALAKLELDAAQGQRLARLANETRCPCPGERASLAECATSCVRGPFALRAIGRYVQRALADDQIASLLLERFGPREREQIQLNGAPCRGAKDAPVTLVVFSDFQCPFCALAAGMVTELEKRAKEKLRVCYKSFLIHKEAEDAVHAAFAAHEQGKFWPFHDKLFANLRAQGKDDLRAYARELGLDVARLERDMTGAKAMNAVLRDSMEARRLRLRGTPSFFLNGRPFTDPKNLLLLQDWLEEELAIKAAAASQPASSPTAR